MQVSEIFSLGGGCGGYGGGGYDRHSNGGYSSGYSNYRSSYRYHNYEHHNGGGLLSIRIGGGRGRDY